MIYNYIGIYYIPVTGETDGGEELLNNLQSPLFVSNEFRIVSAVHQLILRFF